MTQVVRRQRVWTSDDGTHGIDAIHTLTETGEEPMTQTEHQAKDRPGRSPHATPESLLAHLEAIKHAVEPPQREAYGTLGAYVQAEISYARAWGLAAGLVEGGYIEAPPMYTTRHALGLATQKVQRLLQEQGE